MNTIVLLAILVLAVTLIVGLVQTRRYSREHVAYVFLDLSASVTYSPPLLAEITRTGSNLARKHGARLWGFSNEAWPINTTSDTDPARVRSGGTDLSVVLDVVGDEPTIVVTDGAMWQTLIPDNIRLVTVN